jgi:iron-sulfur cluster assembly protein
LLQVSDSAVAVLENARESQEVPDSFGVRIFGEPTPAGQVAISLAFAEEPQEGDDVVEQSGTRVFVAQELAEPLADSVVDLEETTEGAQLVIKPQDDESS